MVELELLGGKCAAAKPAEAQASAPTPEPEAPAPAPFTLRKLTAVDDSAPKFGLGDLGTARFATKDLAAQQTGISHHRLRPGKRQAFGHRHEHAEEVYVVLSGAGRVKLDDDLVELGPLDAIRVAPDVIRAFESGPEGLELLAFGPHRRGDSEILQDWWND